MSKDGRLGKWCVWKVLCQWRPSSSPDDDDDGTPFLFPRRMRRLGWSGLVVAHAAEEVRIGMGEGACFVQSVDMYC